MMNALYLVLRVGVVLGVLGLLTARASPQQGERQVGETVPPREDAAELQAQEEAAEGQEVEDEASQAYRLGPGDVLDIAVYDEPDLSRLFTIQHGGEITFPLLGEVQVSGLTVNEARQLLEELLKKDYLVDPHITIKVKEFQSQWVTLVGEVVRPGKYYLDGPTTLLDLLTEAGGFTTQASGEVIISRLDDVVGNGDSTRHISLSRDMSPEQQKTALALLLENRDLVTVSSQASIYISGEVRNPGSYPLTAGLTVLKAVSLSGGLDKFGSKGKVEILRKTANGKSQRIKVDLEEIEKGEKPDVPLAPGDIVKVGKRVF